MNGLLFLLGVLLLLAVLPTWPYSRRWGYAPSGGVVLLLVILLVILFL